MYCFGTTKQSRGTIDTCGIPSTATRQGNFEQSAFVFFFKTGLFFYSYFLIRWQISFCTCITMQQCKTWHDNFSQQGIFLLMMYTVQAFVHGPLLFQLLLVSGIQSLTNCQHSWMASNRLNFSASKTQFIYFGTPRSLILLSSLNISHSSLSHHVSGIWVLRPYCSKGGHTLLNFLNLTK